MFPHKEEQKLKLVFDFFTRKRIKRARKQVGKGQIPLFTYTQAEQKQMIEELTRIAIDVNLAVFDSWQTLSKDELAKQDLEGAKAWIKKNYLLLNEIKDFKQLEKIRQDRIMDTIKKYDRNLDVLKNGQIPKHTLKSLKQDISNNRASKEIREIVKNLEKGTYSLQDIKTLEKWQSNRNELLARNETGNLYAQEIKDLMIENDMEYFVWRTMQDSRVREEHAEREGKVFSINEVDILPGEDFNCRCSAEPLKMSVSAKG